VEMVKNTFSRSHLRPRFGGGVINDRKIKAIIPGGRIGTVVLAQNCLTCRSGKTKVGEKGSMLGSGSVVVA